MPLTREQFERICPPLPRQRGNVRLNNFDVVNAILYVAANGCKWRALPGHYGPWHTIYTRMSRWARAGVLDGLIEQLQRERLMHVCSTGRDRSRSGATPRPRRARGRPGRPSSACMTRTSLMSRCLACSPHSGRRHLEITQDDTHAAIGTPDEPSSGGLTNLYV